MLDRKMDATLVVHQTLDWRGHRPGHRSHTGAATGVGAPSKAANLSNVGGVDPHAT